METKTAQITLRQAKRSDVLDKRTRGLKLGVEYFMQSKVNPEQLCGPMITSEHTDKKEFGHWFSENLLWVPVMALHNQARFLQESLKQAG